MSGGSGDKNVICIEAKQICDFCFQEHHIERTFTGTPGQGLSAMCQIDEDNIVCREVSRREVDSKKDEVLVCLAIEVPVTIMIFNNQGAPVQTITDRVVFLKQAILCAPAGTNIDCQVTGECCCFVDPTTGLVTCAFDFCVVIQSAVVVRVLVPILGFCKPKVCRTAVAGCPPEADVCAKCDC